MGVVLRLIAMAPVVAGLMWQAPARITRTRLEATAFSAQDVKALRQESGAGMMDCKKALVEAEGDMTKAIEWLRVKGLASAAKKGERATKEGLIETYVHTGGKLGVIAELNCETDFVSKGPDFKEMCRLVAMQIAASPSVQYVKYEDIPQELIAREMEVEMQAEDLMSKPEAIRAKIVDGRVTKLFKEKCLLDQPFIKDPKMTVDEFVKSYVSKLGENIQIARFTKFELGGAVKTEEPEEPAVVEDKPVVAEEPAAVEEAPVVAEEEVVEETSEEAAEEEPVVVEEEVKEEPKVAIEEDPKEAKADEPKEPEAASAAA